MRKKRFVITMVLFFLLLVFPYLCVECQTIIYGNETQDLYKQTNMILENNYQKVFQYNNKKCKVLYADKNTINICTFNKNNENEWSLENWQTIKSKEGSADGFVYPYYGYLYEN